MTTTIPRLGRLPHDRDEYLASISLIQQRRRNSQSVRLLLSRALREDWTPRRVRPVWHRASRMLLLVPDDAGLTVNAAHYGTAGISLSGFYRWHHLPRIPGRLPRVVLLDDGVLAVGPLPREGEQLPHTSNGGRVGCQQQREREEA